jgi:predicted GNAT superfamily acetyltransferase
MKLKYKKMDKDAVLIQVYLPRKLAERVKKIKDRQGLTWTSLVCESVTAWVKKGKEVC